MAHIELNNVVESFWWLLEYFLGRFTEQYRLQSMKIQKFWIVMWLHHGVPNIMCGIPFRIAGGRLCYADCRFRAVVRGFLFAVSMLNKYRNISCLKHIYTCFACTVILWSLIKLLVYYVDSTKAAIYKGNCKMVHVSEWKNLT